MDQNEEEIARLIFIEEMLLDAWAWAEGDHKERLSRIAVQVQAMIDGTWAVPEIQEVKVVQVDNVVYPKFGDDQDKSP